MSRRHTKFIVAGLLRSIVNEGLPAILLAQCQRKLSDGHDGDNPWPKMKQVEGENEEGMRTPSYRSGGQPLRDKGGLHAGLSARMEPGLNGGTIVVQAPLYGIFHNAGFETEGPNFIPLSLAAARGHEKGADPIAEGFVRDEDFIMAWGGVDVPARPFYNPTRDDLREIRDTLILTLEAELGAKRTR